MKSRLNLIILMLIIIGVSAFLAGIYFELKPSKSFIIALTEEHLDQFKSENTLPKILNKGVELKIYQSRNDLLKAVYSEDIDAYIVDAFHYIQNYQSSARSRAIYGIPTNKYLVAKTNEVISRPRIASFDEIIANVLINNKEHSVVLYDSEKTIINALHSDFVDLAVLTTKDVATDEFYTLNSLVTLGFTEDVLILSSKWFTDDTDEHLEIITALNAVFKQARSAPDEVSLLNVMGYLFKAERIPTRYYYKDLVYTEPIKP